jgi:uncharacterized membrane protein
VTNTSAGGGPPPPPTPSASSLLQSPQTVYLLYFGGFILAVLALIGVVLAYVNRDSARPLDRSHYDFQIATFWRGLVILAAGIVTVFIVVGWLIILFWAIWTIVRNIKGLSAFGRGQPMPANVGWGFG